MDVEGKKKLYAPYWLAAAIVAAWLGMRIGAMLDNARDFVEALPLVFVMLPADILLHPFRFELGPVAQMGALLMIALVASVYSYWLQSLRATRPGEEYGGSRKGTVREGEVFKDKDDPYNNIIVSKHLGIQVSPGSAERKVNARHCLIIGGTGAGKTAGSVEPNILQLCKSDRDALCSDPKRATLERTGFELVKNGVEVFLFDTVYPEESDCYNPFWGVTTDTELVKVIEDILANTNDGKKSNEPIWDNGEKEILRTFGNVYLEFGRPEELTLGNILKLVDLLDVSDDSKMGPIDWFFYEVEHGEAPDITPSNATSLNVGAHRPSEAVGVNRMVDSELVTRDGRMPAKNRKPDGSKGFSIEDSVALKVWKEFRSGAEKTLQSFVISLHTRFVYMSTKEITNLLGGRSGGQDHLHLELLGQTHDAAGNKLNRRCIFVSSSDYDSSLNALFSIALFQAIRKPLLQADTKNKNKRLPRPVSLFLDEFRNAGKLANFPQTVQVARSRNMDLQIYLQSLSQLDDVYGEHGAKTIIEGCPTLVYLGGSRAMQTAEMMEKYVGIQTIVKKDSSRKNTGVFGADDSISTSSLGRAPWTAEEIARLPQSDCLVITSDLFGIQDKKSWNYQHLSYDQEYMGDPNDPKNAPTKRFDYPAWRDAGRPLNEDAVRWEKAYLEYEAQFRDEARQAQLSVNEGELELANALAELRRAKEEWNFVFRQKKDAATLLERELAQKNYKEAVARHAAWKREIPVRVAELNLARAKAELGLRRTLVKLGELDDGNWDLMYQEIESYNDALDVALQNAKGKRMSKGSE